MKNLIQQVSIRSVFWDVSQQKEQNHCLGDPSDPQENKLTDRRSMLPDPVW